MKPFIEKIQYPIALIASGLLVFGVVVTYRHISIDDPAYVFNNPYLKNLVTDNIVKFLFLPYANMIRPLDSLVYLIEYKLWGLTDAGYHLTNLLFHITNSILVFVLLGSFIKEKPYRFLAALLFLLHPVQVETVAWISEQKSTLSTMFLLFAMISYIKFRREQWPAGKWITFVCFISGMLVKPNIVILPVLLVWYDFVYVRQPLFKSILEKYYFWILSAVIGVIYLFFVHKTGFTTTLFGGSLSSHILTTISNIAGITQYPAAMVFPFYIHMIAYPDNPIIRVLSPEFLISLLMLLVAAYAMYYAYKRQQHTVLFFIGWYYINFLLASGVIPIAYQGAVRYLYIPVIGPIVLFVMGILWIQNKIGTAKNGLTVVVSLIVCSYAVIDLVSAGAWKNELAFWKYQVWSQPGNGRDRAFLADTLVAYHDTGLAIEQAEKAGILSPYDPVVWSKIFTVYYNSGMYDAARKSLDTLHSVLMRNYGELDPALLQDSGVGYDVRNYYFLLYSSYADVYFKTSNYDSSVMYGKKALALQPANEHVFALTADGLLMQHKADEVLPLSREFIKLVPGSSTGYLMRALAYEQTGKPGNAISNLDKALPLCKDTLRRDYMIQKRKEMYELMMRR